MITILCVEDEASLREDIAEELEEAGYDVKQAGDGNEGLEMIQKYVVRDRSQATASCCR